MADQPDEAVLAVFIEWLNSFENTTVAGPEALCDGVAFAQVLHDMVPQHFTDSMLGRIHRDSDSSKVRIMNLQKVVRSLYAFYETDLQCPQEGLPMVMEDKVEAGDRRQLLNVLELLLGCAIQCEKATLYMSRIESLPSAAVLMPSMQKIITMSQQAAAMPDSPAAARRVTAPDDDVAELRHKLQNLQMEHDAMVDDHHMLEEENKSLRQRLNEANSASDAAAPADGEVQRLQTRIDDLEQLCKELEADLDDEKRDREQVKRDADRALAEMRRQMQRSMDEAAEAAALRDEVVDLRLSRDENTVLRDRVDHMQTRISELQQALSSKDAQLEEKLKKEIQLESSAKRSDNLAEQLARVRSELDTAEAQLLEEQKRADSLDFAHRKLTEQFKTVQQEKQSLLREKAVLQTQVDEVQAGGGGMGLSSGGLADMEKVMRLEHEVETLRAQVGSPDEQVQEMQSLLDKAQQRKTELEAENRKLNLQIVELRAAGADGGIKSTDELVFEQLAVAERDLRTTKASLEEKVAMETKLRDELSKAQQQLIDLQKTHSLVGKDQRDLIEQARAAAEQDVADKLAKFDEVQKQLEEMQTKCTELEAERSRLQTSLQTQMDKVNKLYEDKDKLTTDLAAMQKDLSHKLLAKEEELRQVAMQGGGGASAGNSADVTRLQEQLQQARQDYTALANKLTTLGSESGGNEAIDILQQQLKETRQQLTSEQRELERVKQRYETELELVASAWASFSLEYQKLSIKSRDGLGGSAPGGASRGSFLELQRRAALEQHAIIDA